MHIGARSDHCANIIEVHALTTTHRVVLYRINAAGLPNPPAQNQKGQLLLSLMLVGAGGFGPPKSLTTDLQSAPFGRSGTLPYLISLFFTTLIIISQWKHFVNRYYKKS